MQNIINQITLTLKEITDLLNVQHSKAMARVLKMAENKSFGSVSIVDSQYESGKGRVDTIKTLVLNKRQSIAAASALDVSLLMKVIDRLEELENSKPKPKSTFLMLAEMAMQAHEIELVQLAQQEELERQHKKTNRLENNIRRVITEDTYFTVIGYCNLKGIDTSRLHTPSIGRKAGKLSKERGLNVGKVHDAKYGLINTYHKEVLGDLLND